MIKIVVTEEPTTDLMRKIASVAVLVPEAEVSVKKETSLSIEITTEQLTAMMAIMGSHGTDRAAGQEKEQGVDYKTDITLEELQRIIKNSSDKEEMILEAAKYLGLNAPAEVMETFTQLVERTITALENGTRANFRYVPQEMQNIIARPFSKIMKPGTLYEFFKAMAQVYIDSHQEAKEEEVESIQETPPLESNQAT